MKLYEYYGTVSEMECLGGTMRGIVLHELYNDDKPPTRLNVCGAMAQYICDIEMTDAEERYLNAKWYYDRNLFLRRIEIPSRSPNIPAKIITQEEFRSDELIIFGPEEYIKTSSPKPMSKEDFQAWMRWKAENI